ncbi:hypothetical protein QBC44DRAFT_56808 [Cladorrhinum sp. PSN332]|nr:hypothetical protein QBC44DRAFT_56808 [Cladorrhinum sp. PSN332]
MRWIESKNLICTCPELATYESQDLHRVLHDLNPLTAGSPSSSSHLQSSPPQRILRQPHIAQIEQLTTTRHVKKIFALSWVSAQHKILAVRETAQDTNPHWAPTTPSFCSFCSSAIVHDDDHQVAGRSMLLREPSCPIQFQFQAKPMHLRSLREAPPYSAHCSRVGADGFDTQTQTQTVDKIIKRERKKDRCQTQLLSCLLNMLYILNERERH